MNFIDKNPALLLIDIQKAFLDEDYPGLKRNNLNAEFVCGEILNKWRILNLPIIHIRHSSKNKNSKLHPSSKGFEFNDYVKPLKNEIVLTKNVNSAFIGTDLEKILSESSLTLGELEFLARSWLSRFFAFLHSRVSSEVARLLQSRSQFAVEL